MGKTPINPLFYEESSPYIKTDSRDTGRSSTNKLRQTTHTFYSLRGDPGGLVGGSSIQYNEPILILSPARTEGIPQKSLFSVKFYPQKIEIEITFKFEIEITFQIEIEIEIVTFNYTKMDKNFDKFKFENLAKGFEVYLRVGPTGNDSKEVVFYDSYGEEEPVDHGQEVQEDGRDRQLNDYYVVEEQQDHGEVREDHPEDHQHEYQDDQNDRYSFVASEDLNHDYGPRDDYDHHHDYGSRDDYDRHHDYGPHDDYGHNHDYGPQDDYRDDHYDDNDYDHDNSDNGDDSYDDYQDDDYPSDEDQKVRIIYFILINTNIFNYYF